MQMWEFGHKSWAPKSWCFRTVVLEKTLESPLDSKEIKPVNPKGNQPWMFTGRTDAKSQLIGKDADAGKNWRQKEKGTTEDEMVGWHHWLDGHEFEQTPGDSGGQRRVAIHGVTKSWSWLNDWTTTTVIILEIYLNTFLILKKCSVFGSKYIIDETLLYRAFLVAQG